MIEERIRRTCLVLCDQCQRQLAAGLSAEDAETNLQKVPHYRARHPQQPAGVPQLHVCTECVKQLDPETYSISAYKI